MDPLIAYRFVPSDTPTKLSSDRDISLAAVEDTQLRSNDSLPLNSDFRSWGVCTPLPKKYG